MRLGSHGDTAEGGSESKETHREEVDADHEIRPLSLSQWAMARVSPKNRIAYCAQSGK